MVVAVPISPGPGRPGDIYPRFTLDGTDQRIPPEWPSDFESDFNTQHLSSHLDFNSTSALVSVYPKVKFFRGHLCS